MNAIEAPRPAITKQQAEFTAAGRSPLQIYRDLVVGDQSLPAFVRYELLMTLLSGTPGVLGFGLRSLLYPALFQRCGARPAIGKGVTVRRPAQITIGKKVMIDDFAVLDVRGADASIEIGDYVSIGRYTTIAAKNGKIRIESGVNIGSYCRIATQSQVTLGESTLVAAYAYVGPGNHQQGDEETPLIAREMDIRGGVTVGTHAWIGARATVLDGANIGSRAVVGAHSLVRDSVPDGAVAVGTPARVVAGHS